MQNERHSPLDTAFHRYLERPTRRRLARLVQSSQDHVWKVALALAGHADDAADLCQEVFLSLLLRPPAAGSVRSPRGWLAARIATVACDRRRSADRRRRRERIGAQRAVAEDSPNEDTVEEVRAAVDRLPERLRTVVELRYLAGLSQREIAGAIERSEATVEKDLQRARDLLRRRLKRVSGALALLAATAPDSAVAAPPASAVAGWLQVARWGDALAPAAARGTLAIPEILAMKKTVAALAALAIAAVLGVSLAPWNTPPEPVAQEAAPTQKTPAAAAASGPALAARESGTDGETPSPAVEEDPPAPGDDDADAGPSLGSLRVRLLWAEDAAPAGGLGVTLYPASCVNPAVCGSRGVTRDDGSLLVSGLTPGRYRVQVDRGTPSSGKPYRQATVSAGEEALLVLRLEDYRDVSGIVVDDTDQPVAGAAIWLSRFYLDPIGGSVVERTAADGTFRIRGAGHAHYIAARAPGYAPSSQELLPGGRGDDAEVRLVLPGAGGALDGRVLDPGGEPVPRAIVLVGQRSFDHGAHVAPAPPVERRTDEEGVFEARGLRPGPQPVVARAPGFAPAETEASIQAGRVAHVDVVLEPGARLAGTVTDGSGEAVGGAQVRTGSGTEWAHRSDIALSSARTDPSGHYRLDGLPPGEHTVRVDARDRGEAEALVRLERDRTAHRNFVVTAGGPVAGRVVYEDGRPAIRAQVVVWPQGGRSGRTVLTGPEGRFRAENCDEGPHRVEVTEPGAHLPSVVREDVLPGPDATEIVIPESERASASIIGKVVNAEGEGIWGARVYAERKDRRGAGRTKTSFFGGFEAGPLPPGTYELRIDPEDLPRIWGGTFELAPRDTADAGTLRVPRPGFLEASVRREDGGATETLAYRVYDEEDRCALAVRLSSAPSRRDPLAPGRYRVEVEGDGVSPVEEQVEVEEGRATSVELTVAAEGG